MNKIFLSILCIAIAASAMELPQPRNRFFLRDLMQAYQDRKPLDLANKSQDTLSDIKNWITYARTNEKARAELAQEFKSTPEEIEFVLDILDAEIQLTGQPAQSPSITQPTAAKQPLVLKPTAKPVAAKPKPVVLKPVAKPAAPEAPKSSPLIHSFSQKQNAIQKREGNFIQVKTVDQFKLGQNIGAATCPVQALRNTLHLMRFAKTGLTDYLYLINDPQDAREFLAKVGECGIGTQWLTAEELKRIISKLGQAGSPEDAITGIDTPQELVLHPEQLKRIQDEFKEFSAVHGFIVGTMDVGQFTGDRGHYFSLVLSKIGDSYLYLIADTAPENDHLDPQSYNYKRVRYIADLITKGKSNIDLDKELQKIADVKYQDVMARALVRGANFDFKSLTKNDLEGLERIAAGIERDKNDWKNRTRLNDKQLADALVVVKQKIQEQLKQFQKR